MNPVIKFLLIAVLVVPSSFAFAQDEKGELLLSGKVVNENKRGMQSTIMVFSGKEKVDEFETNWIGKFETKVPLQDTFAMVVYAPNYVSKTVFVNTEVQQDWERSDYAFPFFIDLYPVGRTPSNIDLSRPVGKIIFSGKQFIYDIQFTERQNKMLKEFVRERKDIKVRDLEE